MGRVYRARDVRLSRTVALKVLAPALAGQREALIRLRREAETASRLNHPALVTIFDVGEAPDGQIFIAMELIDGVSLREWFRMPHTAAEIADVLSQAADGLAAAHASGVIHRDVKPDNIMLARHGFAKVVDFGLAKTRLDAPPSGDTPTAFLTQEGTIVGTVAYMAPEQLRGEPLEGASDVFSLGSVLHEALSHHPPFAAATQVETIARVLHEPPPAPPSGTDVRLVALVGRMLAKEPAARPSMQSVAAELRAFARGSGSGVAAAPASRARPWTIAVIAAVVLAAGAAAWLWPREEATPAKQNQMARPADPRVSEVYSRARFFASDREWAAQDKAIPLLEEVVRRDPRFIPARVELARQYARRAFDSDPDRSWEQKAFMEADRILRLDPRSPAAHTVLANLKWTRARGFPHEDSLIELSKALAADPDYADARQSRGFILMHVGLLDEALADLEALRKQSPADAEVVMRIARIHLWRGNAATALREFREYTPEDWQIVIALNALGRHEEALAFAEQRLDQAKGDFWSAYAVVLAARGRRAEAEKAIARAYELGDESSSHFHHALYNIACAWAQMGNAAKTVEALDRVSRDGMPCYPLFARDPLLDPIRTDPRFVRFLNDSRDALEARRRSLARILPPTGR